MALQTKKHVSCPTDDVLQAYVSKTLVDKEHDAVSLHLLICDICSDYAKLLPSSDEGEGDTSIYKGVPDYDVLITPELASAIERFRSRQEHPSLDARKNETAKRELKVGQIWRPKSSAIVVPGEERTFSVAQLDSRPHLIVVTNANADVAEVDGQEYRTIRVVPLTASVEYSGADDLVIEEAESPLGYSFLIETWNQQSMLLENLADYIGAFKSETNSPVLAAISQLGGADEINGSLSLEGMIVQGSYDDPILRFRMREYEDTSYLRFPVEALREAIVALDEETELIDDAAPRLESDAGFGHIVEIIRSSKLSPAVWSGGWKPYELRAADGGRESQHFHNADRSLRAVLTPEGKRMLLRIESDHDEWEDALVPFLWKSKGEDEYRCIFAVLSRDESVGPSYADIKLGDVDEILHHGLPEKAYARENLNEGMADTVRESIRRAFSNHELDAWYDLSEREETDPKIRAVIQEEITR